jgi:hypothetical protein
MVSRRGLFKGLFGLGAAKVLAPIAKMLPVPLLMKYRQPGITTAALDSCYRFGFTGWKEMPDVRFAEGVVFVPPEMCFTVVGFDGLPNPCDIALQDKPIPQVTEGEHYVG